MPRGGVPIPLSELALLGGGALLAVSGIGRTAAAAAAHALIEAGVSALMSFGVAGALDPALEPGSVILPREVLSNEMLSSGSRRYTADAAWRERVVAEIRTLQTLSEGNLLTCGRAIDTLKNKAAAFHDTGAVAVDMESAAVAEVAAGYKLP